jgi:phosphoribosyl-dephospho-CoA transferase
MLHDLALGFGHIKMDWLNKLKEYAPDIATAVLTGGASLAPLALKAIADATGNKVSTQDELQKAVESASPEMMLKVTQANNQFKMRMRELSNELVVTELNDVQNARKHHQHHHMPAIICIALTMMVAVGAYFLFNTVIPEANTTLANLLFGATLAKWGDSIAYWVGTTRSSANKDRDK